jgi:hypothetical protein
MRASSRGPYLHSCSLNLHLSLCPQATSSGKRLSTTISSGIISHLPADAPQEVPDDPGEVSNILQEPGYVLREIDN